MSETTFYCFITNINVNKTNISHWKKLLSKIQNLNIASQRFISKYGATDITQYYEIINDAITNDTINDITANFNKNTQINISLSLSTEQERLKEMLENSKEIIDDNTIIRMLIPEDQTDATNLYIRFKEDNKEDVVYVEDFILKNVMFGIFIHNNLAGFVIIDFKKKFKLDNDIKIDTFYIQEIYIDKKYQGSGLGSKLFKYSISKCPENTKYISLMTKYENLAMIKIAEMNGFIKQSILSGDPYNPLLMIKK